MQCIEEIGTVLEDSLRSQRSFALHTTTNTLENELYPRTRVEHHPADQTLTIIDSPHSYDEQQTATSQEDQPSL